LDYDSHDLSDFHDPEKSPQSQKSGESEFRRRLSLFFLPNGSTAGAELAPRNFNVTLQARKTLDGGVTTIAGCRSTTIP